MSDLTKLLPMYDVTIHITHNQHKAYYMTAEDYLNDGTNGQDGGFDPDKWVSYEDFAAAVETDSIWELQWYPDTPISYYVACGSTLENALRCASNDKRDGVKSHE